MKPLIFSPVGVPLATLIVMYRERRAIKGSQLAGPLARALRLMYRAYTPRFYLYELLEVCRRIAACPKPRPPAATSRSIFPSAAS